MFEKLPGRGSLRAVACQCRTNKVFGPCTVLLQRRVIGVSILDHSSINFTVVLVDERVLMRKHEVCEHTNGPDVDQVVVRCASSERLGCHVLCSSDLQLNGLEVGRKVRREAKVD